MTDTNGSEPPGGVPQDGPATTPEPVPAPAAETPAASVAAPTPVAAPAKVSVWKRRWFPYLLLPVVGAIGGFAWAVSTVNSGELGSGERIGAWETGRDFGSADQSARTRAIVARRGLLALPASEARYYTASVDDSGDALVANCAYRLTGGRLTSQFWTITLYDPAGYLVANDAHLYSVSSAAMSSDEQGRWTILVSTNPQPGRWLPTGGGTGQFALTLRAYLPADGGRGNFTAAELPSIRKEACQ